MHFLKHIFSDTEFSKEKSDLIISNFKRVNLKKHDFFQEEGKVAQYYYFIQSGFARSYAIDAHGNDITTNFYNAGDILIDWYSFIQKTPALDYIQSLTDCEGWQIEFNDFQHMFSTVGSFRDACRSRLVSSYFQLKKHSVSMITLTAKERYLQLLIDKPQIVQNVSLKHIATYLGITDTSLSRIRKEIAENV
ncbi:Crp/Fnr family transcriptional regulator [marine bacterium AO1-C]|nr:Crp/Fnr family transcriptional regulator [marine bacterium AO1-C]